MKLWRLKRTVRNYINERRHGRQVCPRRHEGPVPCFCGSYDVWEKRKDGHLHCSYCGSLHPETAIRLLEEGARFDRTTKSYKGYILVKGKNGEIDQLKFYIMHFDRDQVNRLNSAIGAKA